MKYPTYLKYRESGVTWLGQVPWHWEIKRLKMSVHLTDRKVEANEENPVPYIGLENIESWTGKLLPIDHDIVPSGVANQFSSNSTLFGKLRPYLAKACNPDFGGLCSTELLVLESEEFDRRALLYWLLADGFIKLVDSSTYGSKMPRANWEFIGNCLLPVPPLPEQTTIANFLDRETGRIDQLTAKKRQLIERLKEKRAALISRTVTRGLPADAAREFGLEPHTRFKDSGVEWLGKVPEGWEVTHLKYATSMVVDCPHETPLYDSDGIYQVVRTADLSLGLLDLSNAYRVDEDEYLRRIRRSAVEPGDILYGREGERWGFAATAPETSKVCLGQRMMQFRAASSFEPGYLMWHLNAGCVYEQGVLDTAGSTAPHVNVSTIRNYWLVSPPLPEQTAIAAYLDRETAKIDRLTAKVEEAIERLREYRTSLITAAVTGKIDVSSVPVKGENSRDI